MVPMTMKAEMTPNWDGLQWRTSRWLNMLARVKPGGTPPQAEAAMTGRYRQITSSS